MSEGAASDGVTERPARRWTDVHWVGVAAAFALLGDSSIYAVLPTESERLGLTALEVGVLLSVNRFARILFNRSSARALLLVGLRGPLVFALLLAAGTTFAYGHTGFAAFVTVRVLWGLCWSLLRNGANGALVGERSSRIGELQGSFRSLSRVGSLVAVVGGAWLVGKIGFHQGYAWLGVATLPGVLAALAVKPGPRGWLTTEGGRASPEILGVSLAAFVLNAAAPSLLLATTGLAIQKLAGGAPSLLGVGMGVATIAGIATAGRWLGEIFVAPLAGALADRAGRRPVILGGGALGVLALLGCAEAPTLEAFVVAAILAFAALSAFQTGLDALATDRARAHPISLGWYFTVVDVGTAFGPLLGPLCLVRFGRAGTYAGSAVVVAAVAAAYIRGTRSGSVADNAGLHPDG